MYIITYEQGNGYRCGCCRQTWTNTDEVESKEDVFNWLYDYEADSQVTMDDYGDSDDRELISITCNDEDLTEEFKIDPVKLKEIVKMRFKLKEDDKRAKEEKIKKEQIEVEKRTLKILMAKYPDEVNKINR